MSGQIIYRSGNRYTQEEKFAIVKEHFPGLLNRVKLKYVAEFLGISIYTLSRIRSSR